MIATLFSHLVAWFGSHSIPLISAAFGWLRRRLSSILATNSAGRRSVADARQKDLDEFTQAYRDVVTTENGLSDKSPYDLLGRGELRTTLALLGASPASDSIIRQAADKCAEVADLTRAERKPSFVLLAEKYQARLDVLRREIDSLRGVKSKTIPGA